MIHKSPKNMFFLLKSIYNVHFNFHNLTAFICKQRNCFESESDHESKAKLTVRKRAWEDDDGGGNNCELITHFCFV